MKIIGLLIVKDEADILQEMLDHNAKCLDGIIAIDNGSTDGTLQILQSHPLVKVIDIDSELFNEARMVPKLIELATPLEADWYVDIDADEFFSIEIREILESVPTDKNVVTVNIDTAGEVKCNWRRIYRNKPELFDYSEIQQLHHGKVPFLKGNEYRTHLRVIHKQVRSYAQGMRKYERYKALDTTGIQHSYEHIREAAEAFKKSRGQLEKWQSDQLWPRKTNKIYFLTHVKDGGQALGRCLESVKPIADEMVVLVDDRTTDNTREIAVAHNAYCVDFKWHHSFSRAKNECLQIAMDKCGLKYGDWVMFMGDDFELQTHCIDEIRDFVKGDNNFFAQFWVPEYSPIPGGKVVSRKRKLLWRHHPMIYWEKSVHEEAVYSAYRLTGQGIPFGDLEWKDFPILGGANGMLHYGYHEDGGEHGEHFWWKKGYYLILYQIDQVRYKYNIPETEDGMKQALSLIVNYPVSDTGKTITELTTRYSNGDIPKGLSKFIDRELNLVGLEYAA